MLDIVRKVLDTESVLEVTQRIQQVITGIDSKYGGDNMVLVSHADVLQIIQYYVAGLENTRKS